METPKNDPKQKRLDDATSDRLAKLRAVPVDISRVKASIESQIPRPPRRISTYALKWFSFRTAAASLLVISLVTAIVIYSTSRPVLASADQLAHIHEEVLAGTGHNVIPVDSVAAANAFLITEWHSAPAIPEIPKDHVMSCCIHLLGHVKMVCVQFQPDGVPITLAVADALDIKLPDSQILTVEGVTYHALSHGQINMVMTKRAGRWICVMGKLPMDQLVELAGSLGF